MTVITSRLVHYGVFWLVRAAVTEHHRLSGFRNRGSFAHSSGNRSERLQGSFSWARSPWLVDGITFLSLCGHPSVCVCVHISFPYKDTSQIGPPSDVIQTPLLFFFLIILFTYLFLTVLGLHCQAGFSLAAARRGHSLVVVYRLRIVGAALAVQHGL